ncbi:MAG: TauD/TfdA family dioxygenase, partial [Pseudomonadota bacterium]
MLRIDPLTPTIGAVLSGIDFSKPLASETIEDVYSALLDHLVIFVRDQEIGTEAHLAFAQAFGDLDEPHPLYPHVDGYDRIVKLENDPNSPPDTNSCHTDLTFKAEQPFASIL